MSFEFLSVGAERLEGRTPITHIAEGMGAHMGSSDGFEVALAFEGVERERRAVSESVVVCDTSHTQKIELQGQDVAVAAAREELRNGGSAPNRLGWGGWWCEWHPQRALLVADPVRPGIWKETLSWRVNILDVTSVWCSLTVIGPSARELISRCCSLDLRPSKSQVGDFHPASIARTPGAILNEGSERFRILVGWAVGQYVWEVLADAMAPLAGQPAGLECLASLSCGGPSKVNYA